MVHAVKMLAYYTYGYRRTTLTAIGVLRLRLQAYHAYGYGHTKPTATGVLGLQLWRTTVTATSVLQA